MSAPSYSGIRSFERTLSILVSMATGVLLPNKQHSSCISAPQREKNSTGETHPSPILKLSVIATFEYDL